MSLKNQAEQFGFRKEDFFVCEKMYGCEMLKIACIARQEEIVVWRGGRTQMLTRGTRRFSECQECKQGLAIKEEILLSAPCRSGVGMKGELKKEGTEGVRGIK